MALKVTPRRMMIVRSASHEEADHEDKKMSGRRQSSLDEDVHGPSTHPPEEEITKDDVEGLVEDASMSVKRKISVVGTRPTVS